MTSHEYVRTSAGIFHIEWCNTCEVGHVTRATEEQAQEA